MRKLLLALLLVLSCAVSASAACTIPKVWRVNEVIGATDLNNNFAYIAATKDQLAKFQSPWAMSMSGEFGFIFALILGLIIGNFFP